MSKVKIISDGVVTKVVDERGELVRGVRSVTWMHAGLNAIPIVELEIGLVEAEIEGQVKMYSSANGKQIRRIEYWDGSGEEFSSL